MAQGPSGARSFDYIIIGGGTAGCVLANRLTEDPGVSVLMLEAGPEAASMWIKMPLGFSRLFAHPTLNWCYSTEPEPNLGGRTVYFPRGKVLGGCSAINGMAYVRGQPEDFDAWERLGNPGWGYADVLPYFKKSEQRFGPASAYHGADGPLAVSDPRYIHPSSRDYIEAGVRLGIRRGDDHNGAVQEGINFLQFNIRNGVRHHAGNAFIDPIRRRSNLTVETGALSQRIIMDGRRAVGVAYERHGTPQQAMAAREVLLAAGATNSPQLLMLSGIGPAAHLQALDIDVVVDLPGVGENFQDHVYVHTVSRTSADSSLNSQMSGIWKILHGANYYLTRRGPLTLGASQATAFVRGLPGARRPDLQINFRPLSHTYDAKGRIGPDPVPGVTVAIYHLQPQSRGRILLKSPDPRAAPAIHANYLAEQGDEDALVAGVTWARRIFETEPLKSRIVSEHSPGEACKSDEDLRAFVRRVALTVCHPVGTCTMGRDAAAVVDERLRVRGVERLRVIDASVMPIITSGNTAAACFMIGEKGADMVKEDRAAA
ncbi:MAG: GMC family oxidoreductase N-terminal domain-containing protein [Rhodospirillales bacterium]|nr:GMC family oxidoreductase N-terminal domain-containing protein [Rhodospirillales bacterium]